jgi:hypothetical protein
MNHQEIFDNVVKHFSIQRTGAYDNGRCSYLTRDGKKCAVGALILEEVYDANCEDVEAHILFEAFPDMMRASGLCEKDAVLLTALQEAHDALVGGVERDFLRMISSKLLCIASVYRLDASSLALLSEQEVG